MLLKFTFLFKNGEKNNKPNKNCGFKPQNTVTTPAGEGQQIYIYILTLIGRGYARRHSFNYR